MENVKLSYTIHKTLKGLGDEFTDDEYKDTIKIVSKLLKEKPANITFTDYESEKSGANLLKFEKFLAGQKFIMKKKEFKLFHIGNFDIIAETSPDEKTMQFYLKITDKINFLKFLDKINLN